ncbi:MAG: DegV family protein [Candidatus Dormibacteria bacterium]
MAVRIVCDSTADLDDAFRSEHRVDVVPLKVIIGDEVYHDGVDIKPAQVYARMRHENVTVRTSQPTPAEFEEVFGAATDDGSAVVCTTISAELSGTYASAVQACNALPDRNIRVIDTRTVTVAHYAVVVAALDAAERGDGLDNVAVATERAARSVRFLFTVETLEYLRRGGRIGGARALMGSMLDIKPILDCSDGRIEATDRVRTYRRAIEACADGVVTSARQWGGARVYVCHADARQAATMLRERIEAADASTVVTEHEVGPVVGVHGGPGSVGVGFLPA